MTTDDRPDDYSGEPMDLPQLDHDHSDDISTPAGTLDRMREGGMTLVALSRTKVSELELAIFEGRFVDAFTAVQQLAQKLQPLAQAEGALAALAEYELIEAQAVTEGMVVRGVGTVNGVRRDEKPVPGDEPCVHIHLAFEEDHDDVEMHATDEVLVVRP